VCASDNLNYHTSVPSSSTNRKKIYYYLFNSHRPRSKEQIRNRNGYEGMFDVRGCMEFWLRIVVYLNYIIIWDKLSVIVTLFTISGVIG
jgi:hypothetical protein